MAPSPIISLRRSMAPALLMALAACSNAAQAASYTMFRDPNCGCCEEWADHVHAGMQANIAVEERSDMGAIKDREGVPVNLRSCHTMVVDGYVIEGLTVPGMPIGSPGMEMGDRTQPYQVIAFGSAGRTVFASYE